MDPALLKTKFYHNRSLQMNMPNKQRGFTLVEIAIVLVIIGLLLGGILKGQELITSARVRNIADQNSGIQAAYYGFIDRYRQIPGDMNGQIACQQVGNEVPGCPGAGVGGNGNGRLEEEDWAEGSNAWAHLAAARFIQGGYVGAAADEATYTITSPIRTPINAFNGRVMLTRSDEYEGTGGGTTVRLLFILGNNIPVNVMRELDLKIDDGLPRTGVVRSTPTAGGALGLVAARQAECVLAGAPDIWDINGNAQDCNAAYLY